MSEKMPITPEGEKRLREELKQWKGPERKRIADAIQVAREHGDLSENFEYKAAKDEQGLLAARIAQLEDTLARAQVIDPREVASEKVGFGATVKLVDCDTGKESVYTLVGDVEADIRLGLVSIRSPVGKALLGKLVDDFVIVKAPGGDREYEIVELSYPS